MNSVRKIDEEKITAGSRIRGRITILVGNGFRIHWRTHYHLNPIVFQNI